MEDSIVEENVDEGINLWETVKLLLIGFVLGILAFISVYIVVHILSHFIKTINVYRGILAEIAWYCVFIKYVKDNRKYKIRTLPMPEVKYFLYAIVLLIGYRLIYDNSLAIVLDNILIHNSYQNQIIKELSNTASKPIVGFISLCIIPPVFEEIVYRGIILEQLSKRFSTLKAIAFSAILFAILHLNIVQGVNAFLLGVILGWLYLKTGSILPGILVHFLNNFSLYFFSYFPIKYIVVDGISIPQLILGAAIFIVTIIIIKKKEQDGSEALNI